MEEFYLAVWDYNTLCVLAKMRASHVPQPGSDVTVDFDDPTTEAVEGVWLGEDPITGSFTFSITRSSLSPEKLNGLPVVESQLAYES